jgi:hypothetical protein
MVNIAIQDLTAVGVWRFGSATAARRLGMARVRRSGPGPAGLGTQTQMMSRFWADFNDYFWPKPPHSCGIACAACAHEVAPYYFACGDLTDRRTDRYGLR